MRIPETSNPHFQHAFKKGYRMALDGRKVDSMPSDFRRDMELRQYFQQGWEQAVEDVTLAQTQMNKPDWKNRFVWFAITIIGGIASALHIINLYEEEQIEQQKLIQNTTVITTHNIDNSTIVTEPSLRLLNEQAHKDIKLNKQEVQSITPIQPLQLEPIMESTIDVKRATLTESVENREPNGSFEKLVPKYIRQLSFFTEITNANEQVIYHQWRTDKQILATIRLPVNSNQYRTWSTKKLASAWQGQWYVEVLDKDKQVIYRHAFTYGNQIN